MQNVSQKMTQGDPPKTGSKTPSSKTPAKTRILFICHAEEMLHRYHGLDRKDSGLTALGWEQANDLAQWLHKHEQIDVLICGPKLHHRFTALRISQLLGIPLQIEQSSDYGFEDSWELDPQAQTVTTDPIEPEELLHLDIQNTVAEIATLQAAEQATGQTIAIVIDNETIASLLCYFLQLEKLHLLLDYTSITQISSSNQEQWVLDYLNRREHDPVPPRDDSTENTISRPLSLEDISEDLGLVVEVYNKALCATTPEEAQGRQQRVDDLLNFAKLPTNLDVLDLGTGVGLIPLALAEAGAKSVIGIDICPAMLECAEYSRLRSESPHAANVSYRLTAAQILPFSDQRFDVVVCRLILHLAQHPEKIIAEAMRVLKPGGLLLFCDLLCDEDPVKRATQNVIAAERNPAHVAARSANEYRQYLTDVGLVIRKEKQATFERSLEGWLDDLQPDAESRASVGEMIEAGLETDASGMKAYRSKGDLFFYKNMFFALAEKSE